MPTAKAFHSLLIGIHSKISCLSFPTYRDKAEYVLPFIPYLSGVHEDSTAFHSLLIGICFGDIGLSFPTYRDSCYETIAFHSLLIGIQAVLICLSFPTYRDLQWHLPPFIPYLSGTLSNFPICILVKNQNNEIFSV